MTRAEILAFEEEPFFEDVIKVGRWGAEESGAYTTQLPITYFKKIVADHLRYGVY